MSHQSFFQEEKPVQKLTYFSEQGSEDYPVRIIPDLPQKESFFTKNKIIVGASTFALLVALIFVTPANALLHAPGSSLAAATEAVDSPFFFSFSQLFSNIASLFSPPQVAVSEEPAKEPTINTTPVVAPVINIPTPSTAVAPVPTSAPAATAPRPTQTPVVQNNTYPVVERTVERVVSGVTDDVLTERLSVFADALRQEIFGAINTVTPTYSGGGITNTIALAQHIDKLNDVIISNLTVNGIAGLVASDIPALPYVLKTGGTLTGALTVVGATSTLSGLALSNLNCSINSNSGKLTTDASGNIICADDVSGSGSGSPGGANTNVQFNDAGSFGGNAGFTYNKNANRATLTFASTTAFSTGYASTTNLFAGTLSVGTLNGLLTTTNGLVSNISTSSLGLLASTSIIASAPLNWNPSTGAFTISQSGASTDGYLSSADYNNFNARLSTTTLGLFDKGYFFSTTSANAFINASSTIPHALGAAYGDVFIWNGSRWITTATSTLGITSNGSGSVFGKSWEITGTYLAPTSTIGIIVSASSTFNGALTVTGNTTLGNATTTGTLFASIASSTNLYGAGLASCQGGNVLTWNNGIFGCAADQTSAGGANPFTWSTNFGQITAATSSVLNATNGIFASSTSRFENLSVNGTLSFPNAGTIASPLLITFAGNQFLSASSTAHNTSLGISAGAAISSGNGNSAFGYQSLFSNTTGAQNTAAGEYALNANTSGNFNTAFGATALQNSQTGISNVGIGAFTLFYNTTGSSNVGVGAQAVGHSTSTDGNVGIGYNAAYGAAATYLTGAFNTAIGYEAYQNYTTGNYNSLLGVKAGINITTGASNVILGGSNTNANENLTTGSQNVKIGVDIQLPSATANGQLNIQNILFGTGNTATGATLSTGSIGVGSTSPFAKFSIQANNSDTNLNLFAVGSSTQSATSTLFSVSNTGSTTLYQISSSLLKTNANGTIVAAVAGTDYALPGAGSVGNWFTPGTNFGQNVNSTSTIINFTQGIFASSTSNLSTVNQYGTLNFATTTTDVLTKFNGTTFLSASSTAHNTLLGISAGAAISSGSENNAFGYQSLFSNTTGSVNSAFGEYALTSNTTGSYNAALGSLALQNSVSGSSNVGIGSYALLNNLIGSNNVGVGTEALHYATSTNLNVAIGFNAALGAPATYLTGGSNTAIGAAAYKNYTTGSFNSLIGYQSGYNITTGSSNVILGGSANNTNENLTTGSQNVKIGVGIQFPSATANGQLNIQNILFGTGNTGTDSTLSTGNIGVGTTTPWGHFSIDTSNLAAGTPSFVVGSSTRTDFIITQAGMVAIGTSSIATTTTFIVQGPNTPGAVVAAFTNGTGTCSIDPTGAALSCSSDIRLKHNISTLSETTSKLLSLNPVDFNWNTEATGMPVHSGFIAQQVETLLPDLVATDQYGMKSLNYAGLTPYLVKGFQELDLNLETVASTTANSTPQSRSFADSFFLNMFGRMTAWLADAGNGIADIFATNLHAEVIYAKTVHTDELCVGAVCVTEAQFLQLIGSNHTSTPSDPTPPADSSSSTPPTSDSSSTPTVVDTPPAETPPPADTPVVSDASSTPPAEN